PPPTDALIPPPAEPAARPVAEAAVATPPPAEPAVATPPPAEPVQVTPPPFETYSAPDEARPPGEGRGLTPPPVEAAAAPPPKPISVRSRAVAFAVPGGWTTASGAPAIPGFAGSPAAMSGPGGASVVAGLADKSAANPALLSRAVVKANGGTPSGRQTVNG